MQELVLKQSASVLISEPGEYAIVLAEPGIEADIRGAWEVRGDTKCEVVINVIHAARQTTSHINLRGVARDQAQLSFQGDIIVQPKAQQTNAFLEAKVLLLSPRAWATAKPNLEIEANDVKCSHAATVSDIPEEELFYLQSRGLPLEQAESLIVDGFLTAGQIDAPDFCLAEGA